MDEKTRVNDIDRSVYDIKDEEKDAYRLEAGLTPQIVTQLSREKHDPAWMEQFRLEALQIYNETKMPNWGPSIEGQEHDRLPTVDILIVLHRIFHINVLSPLLTKS